MSLTPEQVAMRLTGIGGSEVSALVGLNPFSSPIDIWRAKVEGLVFEGNEATERGNYLEPAVAAWYADQTGAVLREVGTVRHPSSSIALATPDRIATVGGRERLLEIKTANIRQLDKWGEADDEVPTQYLAQVQWTMACVGLHEADLAVLIAGDTFRIYHLKRDLELESMLLEAAEDFWVRYVVTKTPPPPDASEAYGKFIADRFQAEKGATLQANLETTLIASRLKNARAAVALAEAEEQAARNELLARMHAAGAEKILGDRWSVSYGLTKGRAVVHWEDVVREAGVPEALVQKHTVISPSFRTFRPTFKESK